MSRNDLTCHCTTCHVLDQHRVLVGLVLAETALSSQRRGAQASAAFADSVRVKHPARVSLMQLLMLVCRGNGLVRVRAGA